MFRPQLQLISCFSCSIKMEPDLSLTSNRLSLGSVQRNLKALPEERRNSNNHMQSIYSTPPHTHRIPWDLWQAERLNGKQKNLLGGSFIQPRMPFLMDQQGDVILLQLPADTSVIPRSPSKPPEDCVQAWTLCLAVQQRETKAHTSDAVQWTPGSVCVCVLCVLGGHLRGTCSHRKAKVKSRQLKCATVLERPHKGSRCMDGCITLIENQSQSLSGGRKTYLNNRL